MKLCIGLLGGQMWLITKDGEMTEEKRLEELTRLLEQATGTTSPMEKARLLPEIITHFFEMIKSLRHRVNNQQEVITELKETLRKLGVITDG